MNGERHDQGEPNHIQQDRDPEQPLSFDPGIVLSTLRRIGRQLEKTAAKSQDENPRLNRADNQKEDIEGRSTVAAPLVGGIRLTPSLHRAFLLIKREPEDIRDDFQTAFLSGELHHRKPHQ